MKRSSKEPRALPRADRILDVLARLGATHLLGIPDNTTAPLFDARRTTAFGLDSLIVSREGEAFAIASGLWLGGKRPVVVIQNTGLLESGDSLRGTAQRMGVPLLCLIGYRGHTSLERGSRRDVPAPDRAALVQAELDSVAVLTEPTLRAWGVPFERLGDDMPQRLEAAWQRAWREQRPVAVLLDRELDPC